MANTKKVVEPEAPVVEVEPEVSPVLTTDDIKVIEPTVEGYSVVVSATGHETTVPDSIKQSLLDSGYTEK